MATEYDIITVGGGLGGAALAKAMAEKGARVLVLERETRFKDRVRGEVMVPWGVAEAQALGIYDLLLATCAHELPWWDTYLGPALIDHRDLAGTTPQGVGALTFFHPQMQETLLSAASKAGADVRRGARVRTVQPGTKPTVSFQQDGRTETVSARLVVGADGRNSMVRKWGGFPVQREPERHFIAGLLFEEMAAPEDTATLVFNPFMGHVAIVFPQGHRRVRSYFCFRQGTSLRLQGSGDISRFTEGCVQAGLPQETYAGAKPSGPLATFDAADSWVAQPYKDGVALVGDAAAASDPTWGQGLSLTLRDVRVLRDALLTDENWDKAGHAYAEEHDGYYGIIRTSEDWFSQLFTERGPEADARRARALPKIVQEPDRVPDVFIAGPDGVSVDEAARKRCFGED